MDGAGLCRRIICRIVDVWLMSFYLSLLRESGEDAEFFVMRFLLLFLFFLFDGGNGVVWFGLVWVRGGCGAMG